MYRALKHYLFVNIMISIKISLESYVSETRVVVIKQTYKVHCHMNLISLFYSEFALRRNLIWIHQVVKVEVNFPLS